MAVINQIAVHPLKKKRGSQSVVDKTRQWLRLLGITDESLTKIKFIHVAGTKGKGTTCRYAEALLVEYAKSRQPGPKIGCLASPHFSSITERIRLQSCPITRELFAHYALEAWGKMENCCRNQYNKETPSLPGRSSFLTILGFYVFVHENIDIAVIETGVGGETDSTNIIPRPSATGITSLGFDHTNKLGTDIRDIAWHKAGIFKPRSRAVTIQQQYPSAMEVLRQRSVELRVTGGLKIVTGNNARDFGVEVHPSMEYQMCNAALAIHLVEVVLKEIEPDYTMTSKLACVLNATKAVGSNLIIHKKNIWLLDSAHNEMSITMSTIWAGETLNRPEHINAPRVLLFNHNSHRDGKSILKIVANTLKDYGCLPFDNVVFCTNWTGNDERYPDLYDERRNLQREVQVRDELANLWVSIFDGSNIIKVVTVQDAVDFVDKTFHGATVCVTGSLYLNGAVCRILSER